MVLVNHKMLKSIQKYLKVVIIFVMISDLPILDSGMMDDQSDIINKHLAINISDSLEISKGNIGSVCVPNANESQLNNDLETLMKIVPFLVPILFSIIIITGFFGNILVVCVVTRNKNMRNTTNLLILNLAVSLLYLLFYFTNTTMHMHQY